ncbi:MAG: hypothetical protein IPL88_08500 [Rhizobiales bacterium]|nr:hypothetical protein [Hyphomicrobiales bacterium]
MTITLNDFARRQAAFAMLNKRAGFDEADVTMLRRLIEETGSISREEADQLFAAARGQGARPASWMGFFIEAITDHVVWQCRPTGVVNESQAEWLIAQADLCAGLEGFGALVNVLAEADRVPLWFVAAVRARAARGAPGAATAMALAAAEEAALAA